MLQNLFYWIFATGLVIVYSHSASSTRTLDVLVTACLFVAEFDYLVFSMLFFTFHLDERFFDQRNFIYHRQFVLTARLVWTEWRVYLRTIRNFLFLKNLDRCCVYLFNHDVTSSIESFLHVRGTVRSKEKHRALL